MRFRFFYATRRRRVLSAVGLTLALGGVCLLAAQPPRIYPVDASKAGAK